MRCRNFLLLMVLSCWTATTHAGLFWYNQQQSFADFIRNVSNEALHRNISPRTVQKAFANIQPVSFERPLNPNKSYRRMGPGFQGYLDFAVSQTKILQGRQLLANNRKLLTKIAHQFQVSPSVIVSLWGLETDFGRLQGDYPEIATLATLAYSNHRHRFFRSELMSALTILEQGKAPIDKLTGSWAGAMGQCQFLPEEYLKYSVDYDHSGFHDIWHNKADVFATMANYLNHLGWNPQHGIVIPVKLPPHFYAHWRGFSDVKPISKWSNYGVRQLSGRPLPKGNALTTILSPDGINRPSYLVYTDNYRVIYRWNHSIYYVLSVGLFANKLA